MWKCIVKLHATFSKKLWSTLENGGSFEKLWEKQCEALMFLKVSPTFLEIPKVFYQVFTNFPKFSTFPELSNAFRSFSIFFLNFLLNPPKYSTIFQSVQNFLNFFKVFHRVFQCFSEPSNWYITTVWRTSAHLIYFNFNQKRYLDATSRNK